MIKKNPTTFTFSGCFPYDKGNSGVCWDRLGLFLQPGYFSNEFPMSKPLQSAVSSFAAGSCPFPCGNMGQMGTFHGPPTPLYK